MGPAVTIVQHEFSDGFKMLALQLSSELENALGQAKEVAFFQGNIIIQFVTYSRDAVTSENVFVFLKFCISVIEQF